MILALLLTVSVARAGPVDAEVHGDVKTFFMGLFPYDGVLMPEQAVGQGFASTRLRVDLRRGPWRVQAHHFIATQSPSPTRVSAVNTGVALTAPELLPLTWTARNPTLPFIGRTDRLLVGWRGKGVDVTVGRQPVSFGSGLFFTPLDLVSPFTPATIDQEYKPGVDAVRVELYPSVSSEVSLVVAAVGTEGLVDLVSSATGTLTVGTTDLGVMLAAIRGDAVAGVTARGGVGAVGLHGDAALTRTYEGDWFVRAVAGTLLRPAAKTTITGELYVQTFGTTDPFEYLVVADDPRVARGEVWLYGVAYAGAAVSQELTPILTANLAGFVNLTDASALVAPTIAWNVSSEASLNAGLYTGFGGRPTATSPFQLLGPGNQPYSGRDLGEALGVKSEFGLVPTLFFVQMSAYF